MKRVIITVLFMLSSYTLHSEGLADLFGGKSEPAYYTSEIDGRLKVYLTDEIKDPNAYTALIATISSSNASDIDLYLSGNGGSVRSLNNITNILDKSGKTVHVKVYGDVYSAHAMLAISFEDMTAADDNILFLFHIPASELKSGDVVPPEEACNAVDPSLKDRGISSKQKCVEYAKMFMKQFEMTTLPKIKKVLTAEQYNRMLAGEDVTITYKELKENKAANGG